MRYIPREIEPQILRFMEDPEILAISGPRQSGKTTLLKHFYEQLVQQHGSQRVHYVNLEDELEKQRFVQNPRGYIEFYQRTAPSRRHYFLFDEVQYIEQAGKLFKLLFDTYPNIKFIVTGSASLDIAGLGQHLVGRILFFSLYPFSFAEMLKARDERLYLEYQEHRFSLTDPGVVTSPFLDRLSALLQEYMIYGGYPRVVLEPEPDKKITLLRNLFTTYVEKDVIALFGKSYREKVVTVLQYLAGILGTLVNYQDVSRVASVHFKELKTVLSILEQTYVIQPIKPFHRNVVSELKKNPKYYFRDTGLRNALLNQFQFSPVEQGALLENYVFVRFQEQPLAFWRTTGKAEVDFILKEQLVPIEVKLQPKITPSLTSFIRHYHPSLAIVANADQSFMEMRNDTPVYGVPLALL